MWGNMNFNVLSTNIDFALEQTDKLKDKKFQNKPSNEISSDEIIKAFPKTDGIVLLIVAKELNKGKNSGIFIALIFDGDTGKLISENEFTGKAGGFGLRNFWAGAIHSGMKSYK